MNIIQKPSKNFYNSRKGWAPKDQLKQAVTLKIITADDFKTITGEAYA